MTDKKFSDSYNKVISKHTIEDFLEFIYPFFHETNVMKYIVDGNTMQFVAVNHACEKFYGWNNKEFKSMHLQNINQQMISHQSQKKQRFYYEAQHILANGTIKDVNVFCNFIQLANSNCWYEIIYDNSYQKSLEAEIKTQYTFYESILWTLSHDIRSSVARILGLIELNYHGTPLNINWLMKQIQVSTHELDGNIHHLTYSISQMKKDKRPENSDNVRA